MIFNQPRSSDEKEDKQKSSFLGPWFSSTNIDIFLKYKKIVYTRLNESHKFSILAELLKAENVIGIFQGPMEYGPRALGGRSIVGDARSEKMQKNMNLKIKFRESFRPFAPIILEEEAAALFDCPFKSPYMLLVGNLLEKYRIPLTEDQNKFFGIEKLNTKRSSIPAVTHVDYSARLQTISKKENEFCYKLLTAFKKLTGVGVLVNTSFNVRGEPIVCTPEDAYRCFMRTEMDYLLIEDFLIKRTDQPKPEGNEDWKREFVLD
ncbi:carbamoyl transferase, NodU family [sediment metagenome]|uniref:Carbamoyl transferase, NodU family n=1 Tax=sediment metagenome TaxID=749907 RepID=D9PF30_9ZZZZ